jgi:3-deoxy-D-manno-octulosonic acid kinase
MREAEAKSDNARILYDADVVAYALNDWFEPKRLTARGWLIGGAMGRGYAHFFRYNGTDYVLRHYRRGGKIGPLFNDRYLWTGINSNRAWREWRLLARLTELDLPAPRPLAARVIRNGLFYRADLITARIPAASSLAQRLKAGALPPDTWREIGRVIRRFHEVCVWHADLNAHNVLLDSKGAVVLIDFDGARFRKTGTRWREANLARLLRSLRKLKRQDLNFRFCDAHFDLLRAGYDACSKSHLQAREIPRRKR